MITLILGSHIFFRMALDRAAGDGIGGMTFGWTWMGWGDEVLSFVGTLAVWLFWYVIYNLLKEE